MSSLKSCIRNQDVSQAAVPQTFLHVELTFSFLGYITIFIKMQRMEFAQPRFATVRCVMCRRSWEGESATELQKLESQWRATCSAAARLLTVFAE